MDGLASDKSTRQAEYRRRKVGYHTKTVLPAEFETLKDAGWRKVSELKTGIKIRKELAFDEALENDFWCLLYLLGYRTLNVGRKFSIEITEYGGRRVTKQVDVFGLDDETVIVAECKCSQTFTKSRSLQKDLGEFEANKGPIARALTAAFGALPQKPIWLFVTRNIEWSKADLARANEFNIRSVRETDMRYFSEVAKRLGPAARFQFQATYLANTKVGALTDVQVPAVKTKIGGCTAYFFVAPARKLLPICYVNHRDLRDPEASPSYQRLITRKRLESVAAFIKSGGYFANAIIVNFKEQARFDRAAPETEDETTLGMLTLPGTYKSVWVIDGQHRLYGYAELNEDSSQKQRIPVIAFERMRPEEEGRLFKTINTEQKKVAPGLLDALRGEQDLHSDDRPKQIRAIASRVLEQLGDEIGGPFEARFKSSDLPDEPGRTLTLSSMVNALVSSALLGRQTPKPQSRFIQGLLWDDTPTKTINAACNALSAYFSLIRLAAPARWDGERSGLLCTNVGVEAYIRLLAEVTAFIQSESRVDPRSLGETELLAEIERVLEPILQYLKTASPEAFSARFSVPFGSGGPVRYYFALVNLVKSNHPSFNPPGHEEYTRRIAEETVEEVERRLRLIELEVPSYIIRRLKDLYPGDKFLQKSVKNQSILSKAFEKQVMVAAEEQGPLETYIDFIQFKDIVSSKENWPQFAEDLSIRLPDEPHAARYIKWFDEINRLRRVRGHPYGKSYSEKDVDLVSYVYDSLIGRGVTNP